MWKFLTSSRAKGTRIASPNGLYTAAIGVPQEVWGNYMVPLALWACTAPPQLRYHRAGYTAHALTPGDKPIFLYWSACGNWAVFYEFKRQESYQIAFADLAQQQIYRVPAADVDIDELPQLSQQESTIRAFLESKNCVSSRFIADEAVEAEIRVA